MLPETRARIAPVFLALAVVVAYAPSVTGGFLGYDDDWLIRDSPVIADASVDAVDAIVFDLGRDTRLVLGAEYLPVRDLVVWASVRAVGMWAPGLRAIQLVLYVLATLAFRGWFVRVLGTGLASEAAALAFALHPLHAESVAWLAGFKDVLALSFTGLALLVYAHEKSRATRALVVALTVLACLSKAVSVVLPGLLVLHDLLVRRAPDRASISLSASAAIAAAALHLSVGSTVGMVAALPGGSRLSALATMAPVALRYGLRTLGIEPASVVYDVPVRTLSDPIALGSLALLALVGMGSVVAFRRGVRMPLLVLAWVTVALLPVSQVLAPLQNRMADRYLLVALVGPCLALGAFVQRFIEPRVRQNIVIALGLALALVLGLSTSVRALAFDDPIALFIEASQRAPSSPVGPYQLGVIMESTDPAAAEAAFREALSRDRLRTPVGRGAADNLAILLAGSGRTEEAIDLLERAHALFPSDPRLANNLAVLIDARGEHERARSLLLEVLRTVPRYERARATYRSLFGEPPTAPPEPLRFDPGDHAF